MADGDKISRTSAYLDYLPALYREEKPGRPSLLIALLRSFEQVLTGGRRPEASALEELLEPGLEEHRRRELLKPGLEELLEGIVDAQGNVLLGGAERYFRPGPAAAEQAPFEFLDWLAGWVALSLRDNWQPDEKRRILREAVASYRDRGTRAGLQRMVAAYIGLPVDNVEVSDLLGPLVVGKTATVGWDSVIGGGGPPHYFRVHVQLLADSDKELLHRREIIRDIIDAEKPAHTWYDLSISAPTLQVGFRSTVGVDTFLGTPGVASAAPAGPSPAGPSPAGGDAR